MQRTRVNPWSWSLKMGFDQGFVTSALGVTRLAAPQLLVLLEATAVD
jgi:hypothetical protein